MIDSVPEPHLLYMHRWQSEPRLIVMTEIVESQRRSEMMDGIKKRDTAPEITVRRIAHIYGGWRIFPGA